MKGVRQNATGKAPLSSRARQVLPLAWSLGQAKANDAWPRRSSRAAEFGVSDSYHPGGFYRIKGGQLIEIQSGGRPLGRELKIVSFFPREICTLTVSF